MPDQAITAGQRWYALSVKSRHESVAAAGLASKGIEVFAPIYAERRHWSDRIQTLTLPLFPGYIFCRTSLDSGAPVLPSPGVRSFISFAGRPEPVPDEQIETIIRMVASGLPIEPSDYLRAGGRVRIINGPLRGVEGILSQCGDQVRVVVGIEILQRSVSVEIDRCNVEPITSQEQSQAQSA